MRKVKGIWKQGYLDNALEELLRRRAQQEAGKGKGIWRPRPGRAREARCGVDAGKGDGVLASGRVRGGSLHAPCACSTANAKGAQEAVQGMHAWEHRHVKAQVQLEARPHRVRPGGASRQACMQRECQVPTPTSNNDNRRHDSNNMATHASSHASPSPSQGTSSCSCSLGKVAAPTRVQLPCPLQVPPFRYMPLPLRHCLAPAWPARQPTQPGPVAMHAAWCTCEHRTLSKVMVLSCDHSMLSKSLAARRCEVLPSLPSFTCALAHSWPIASATSRLSSRPLRADWKCVKQLSCGVWGRGKRGGRVVRFCTWHACVSAYALGLPSTRVARKGGGGPGSGGAHPSRQHCEAQL